MVLHNYKIDGDSITISKAELEKWRNHYHTVALEEDTNEIKWFYLGKREVMIDILKHFELLMG